MTNNHLAKSFRDHKSIQIELSLSFPYIKFSIRSQRSQLDIARQKLYEIAGGNIDSGDVREAELTAKQRIRFFQSEEFRNWVASEKAAGREVLWLRNQDKTQSAGDSFTFFFKWRADNNKFSSSQLESVKAFLLQNGIEAGSPADVLKLWESKDAGGNGISLADFWLGIYWQSQMGMTEQEKLEQVTEFAPHFASKIYPDVPAENRALEAAGVHVVLVTNGDQALSQAVAPQLGIKPENVVGSFLVFGPDGRATDTKHTYEIFTGDWTQRPQPGKVLAFHYWLRVNLKRFGWSFIDDRNYTIAGRDGDSASADGGMMMLLPAPAFGNFMIDTPGEPARIQKFYAMAEKYGWNYGQYFTLLQRPSVSGSRPD